MATAKQKMESFKKGGADSAALRCRKKFLRFFPKGFYDETYVAWERDYKWIAHKSWQEALDRATHHELLAKKNFLEIATRAVRIESRTNLLFSFEKMALRDAVKTLEGAQLFSEGLYHFLYGSQTLEERFDRWCGVVGSLPRKQTRVLTWPLITVFGFIAQPQTHFFLKPNVTRLAAREYGYELPYSSKPSSALYAELLKFAEVVRRDLRDLRPRDMIDIQSFVWVQGSDEYEE
jgi:hypothetical protein